MHRLVHLVLLATSLALVSAGLDQQYLNRLVFRVLYSLGRRYRTENPESRHAPDSRPDYSFVPLTEGTVRSFTGNLTQVYPHCPAMRESFGSFMAVASLDFGCPNASCPAAVEKARSDYVHAILWAATCGGEFPASFRESLSGVDVPDVIMNDDTDAHIPPALRVADLMSMEPDLYPCSENSGHAFWVVLHAVTANMVTAQLGAWRRMMGAFVRGLYPCFHCRDDFDRIWRFGSPKGEGPPSAAVPAMGAAMPLSAVASVLDANLWLWKLHNVVSIRIHARHWNHTEQLSAAIWTSKRVWPPRVARRCADPRSLQCVETADSATVLRALGQDYCLQAAGSADAAAGGAVPPLCALLSAGRPGETGRHGDHDPLAAAAAGAGATAGVVAAVAALLVWRRRRRCGGAGSGGDAGVELHESLFNGDEPHAGLDLDLDDDAMYTDM